MRAEPILKKFKSLEFTEGKDSFRGAEVAVVNHDPKTGSQALFVKVPPMELGKEGLHYHTGSSHNIVLKGSMIGVVGGEKTVLKAGDYFRLHGGVACPGSATEEGALVFVITDGEFNTVALDDAAKAPGRIETWGEAGPQQLEKVSFSKGNGGLEGLDVAVLGQDKKSGAMAAIARVTADKHDARPHSHTSDIHSLIINGGLHGSVDEAAHSTKMEEFDYYFQPAGAACAGSEGELNGATVFILTASEYGTEYK